MTTKGREPTNQNPKTGEENGSTEKVDFLERGLGERRGGSKKGMSGEKGIKKEQKIP